MNRLTQKIFQSLPDPVFSIPELTLLEPGADNMRHALVKRALASGEWIHLRRGLYCLAPVYWKKRLHPFSVAQRIYGPSYISLESALSWHGWIPEAVHAITSVSCKGARDFDTPLGLFSFRRIPQAFFYAGVQSAGDESGQSFLIASPLKALADYVYIKKRDWAGLAPVLESLRVEPDELETVTGADFDVLRDNYSSGRVQRFCDGLRKELGL